MATWFALCGTASAQDWITWDYCDITGATVDLSVFADLDVARAEREARQLVNGIGRFWRVEAPDGSASHLWGTVHLNHPEFLRLDPLVEAQIKAARVVALEFDPIERGRTKLTQSYAQTDTYVPNDNGTWRTTKVADVLGRERYAWLDARLAGLGWGEGSAPFLRIEKLAEILLHAPCNDFAQGIYPIQDSLIQMIGDVAGAQIMGLEAPDALRIKLSDPKNRALTFDMITLFTSGLDPKITAGQYKSSAALWLNGQTALAMTLEREALRRDFGDNRGPDIQANVDAYLLDERNVIFAETALPELQKGGLFIAVGAAHIAGKAGMVEMLRARGYTVTRIPLPREVP